MDAVSVDDDFVRYGSKSYAINKINSVEVRESQPHGMGGVIALGFIGTVWLVAAMRSSNDDGSAITTGFFAVLCFVLAYFLWQKTKIREYRLFLMTSSSEMQAFMTRDEDYVDSLRKRIEQAMIRHSRAGSDR